MRKRSEGDSENSKHAHAEFEGVSEPGSQDRIKIEAIGAQQIDKVRKGEVEIDMLHAKEDGE